MADALDSGSSGHYARAGSSPVIRSERSVWVFTCKGLYRLFSFTGEVYGQMDAHCALNLIYYL